jgi:hypothetical protein
LDDGEYESQLCGACFEGFSEEMNKRGMPGVPRQSEETKGEQGT